MKSTKIFFTSDHHFFHKAILNIRESFNAKHLVEAQKATKDEEEWRALEHQIQPKIAEMNELMIERWNAVIQPGDAVYHLGDISFGREAETYGLISRLKGRIFLILGNHDKIFEKPRNHRLFEWVKDYYYLRLKERRISLSHYPFKSWRNSHHGAWHLHGHSHGTLADDGTGLSIDVGVDCWDFAPVALEQIEERMKYRRFVPVDHHGKAKWNRGSDESEAADQPPKPKAGNGQPLPEDISS